VGVGVTIKGILVKSVDFTIELELGNKGCLPLIGINNGQINLLLNEPPTLSVLLGDSTNLIGLLTVPCVDLPEEPIVASILQANRIKPQIPLP
jgi:hypothetical protein